MHNQAETAATATAMAWLTALSEADEPGMRCLTGDDLWRTVAQDSGRRKFALWAVRRGSPRGALPRGPASKLRARLPLGFDPLVWHRRTEVFGPFGEVMFWRNGLQVPLSLERTFLLRRKVRVTVQLLPSPARVIRL